MSANAAKAEIVRAITLTHAPGRDARAFCCSGPESWELRTLQSPDAATEFPCCLTPCDVVVDAVVD